MTTFSPASGKLPRHVAIIMDGNGRWAERQGLARVEGHKRGADSVRDIVRAGRELGLEALTLYAFSSQNWERPLEEVQALMQLLRDYVLEERAEIMDNGIRLITIGDTGRLPDFVREPLEALVRDSAQNPAMTLCLALSYGGREAITAVARTLAQEVKAGRLDPSYIGLDTFEARLATTAQGLPPLDLLIRTSGEQRISNFLLWEAAYAELYFTEKLWPDFRRDDLYVALEGYAGRERRYGLTSEQLRVLGK
ncbi:MAG: di-trans,poly-cis-decaprenylcistransferase [Deltaproteobacteria bacterium]|nr:di-trans,poly-cis-decaprenylcistransferase [Deltaproteobacteria bacterium]